MFPGWAWNDSRTVKVLVAAVGDDTCCAGLAGKCRRQAAPTRSGIAELQRTQAAYVLLRGCASHAKMVNKMRNSPPDKILMELAGYESDVRYTFTSLARLDISDGAWERATRATGVGGLGLHSAAAHAAAAFVVSMQETDNLQRAICPSLNDALRLKEPTLRAAEELLSLQVAEALMAGLAAG